MKNETGFIVSVVGPDTLRVELYNDADEPHYTALLLSAAEAMDFSKKVASAALLAAPNKRK